MKFISKPLSILDSSMFVDEIMSWAFGDDGEYNALKHKIGIYFAVTHYCIEDFDFDNTSVSEIYEYIYTGDNAKEINSFMFNNIQISDLIEAANNNINARFDIAKRKTALDKLVADVREYVDEHPEVMQSISVAGKEVSLNG